MHLGRGVTVTRLGCWEGGTAEYLGERVLGQLGFGWERTLEPWRRQHKAISLRDSSFKRQQGFIAINSCFHLMAVVWPVCAASSHPPGLTVPMANSPCWRQTVRAAWNKFSPLQWEPTVGIAEILVVCMYMCAFGAGWLGLLFPCHCSVRTQLFGGCSHS